VATSTATATLAESVGLTLVELESAMPLALTVDGADEIDPQGNAIKGYGRALVREKIVACVSQRLILVAGTAKRVDRLGSRGRLPVEIIPFGLPLFRRWTELHGHRFATDNARTENGNVAGDLLLGPLEDPAELERQLRAVPGVVGTGLFLQLASVVLFGDEARDFELVQESTFDRGTV
jgi:ribose 5-phosphate isomerase A